MVVYSQYRIHVNHNSAAKTLWVFVPGKLLAGFRKPQKLSEINLSGGDIFIIFKESAQQGLIS